MKYRITHKTKYESHESVSIGHNQAWLESRPVNWQLVDSFNLQIDPEPSVRTRWVDAFGNPVHLFSFNEGYRQLPTIAMPPSLSLRRPAYFGLLRNANMPWNRFCRGVPCRKRCWI